MQYKAGTVSVTNGSNIVSGVDTAWLAEASVGDLFTLQNSGVWYQVAAVVSDTSLQLAAPYGGATAAGQAYALTRDFTPNYAIPYPVKGDVDTAAIVARALAVIDSELARIEALVTP